MCAYPTLKAVLSRNQSWGERLQHFFHMSPLWRLMNHTRVIMLQKSLRRSRRTKANMKTSLGNENESQAVLKPCIGPPCHSASSSRAACLVGPTPLQLFARQRRRRRDADGGGSVSLPLPYKVLPTEAASACEIVRRLRRRGGDGD